MKIEVILLSGTLKLSGSTTWLNGLVTGFEKLGIEHAHLVTGMAGELPSKAKLVYYTGRSRSSLYIRLLRWLQIQKLNKKYFKAVEARFFSEQSAKLLQDKLADKVLVIKDFTSYLPEYFIDSRFVVVDVLHQQFTEYQPVGHHDYLVAVSRSVMDNSRSLGFAVDKTIYNPLDVQILKQQSHQYLIEEDSPYLIFVGNIYREKGVFELLSAFAQLKSKTLSGYKLIYIGYGKHFEVLKKEVERLGLIDRVLFKGMLANPYPWIARAELLILPSYSEAMPYVPLEASALGVACLVADFAAAQEFYSDTNIFGGSSVDERVTNLGNAIKRLLGKSENALHSGLMEKIRPEVVADEYYKLLNEEIRD